MPHTSHSERIQECLEDINSEESLSIISDARKFLEDLQAKNERGEIFTMEEVLQLFELHRKIYGK